MPSFPEVSQGYCRWLTAASGSHFGTAIRLLPRPKRGAMEVIYAFCRAADDIVDRQAPGGVPDAAFVESAKRELALWRQELKTCESGFPTHPIGISLQKVMREHLIPVRFFEELLQGVEMDLVPQQYRTFEELRVYCEHVASAVGRMSVPVFGCRHPAAQEYAHDLGVALQLTNILRDIRSDAERGRVYLPQEELKRFDVTEEYLRQGRCTDGFLRLMEFECQRAREFFRKAAQALVKTGEAKKLLPARMMGAVYEELLGLIEQNPCDVFSKRIAVPRGRQLLLAAGTFLSRNGATHP